MKVQAPRNSAIVGCVTWAAVRDASVARSDVSSIALPEIRLTSPEAWGDSLSTRPIVASERFGRRCGLIRRWRGADALVSQPPLDHHYVVLHLGGAKRVTRRGDGATRQADVAESAITIVPAGTRYEWRTEGVIDFAHLYVHPTRLNHAVTRMFDRDAAGVTLGDAIGVVDPLLASLMGEMLAEVEHAPAGCAYMEALFDLALAALVRKYSSVAVNSQPARYALAPVRLRRVLDCVEAGLSGRLELEVLAQAAGQSRFHFSRMFHNAMGEPPSAYVLRRRLDTAKILLRTTGLPLAEIARRTGFSSASHFSNRFKRHAGVPPSDYRRQL